VLSLVIAAALADNKFEELFAMPMTRTTISFTREGMKLIQKAARRQGSSVSQFVREAALMRAKMATDNNPSPMRALAEELRAIGDQGYALAEKALKVAEDEAERKR
jgi:Ribbon-helix-helix protein, copG family